MAQDSAPLDLLIVGAGVGGVIALYYARRAGLAAIVLEREPEVGGLWARLPAWQDIQFGRVDWTLGDLPIEGEDQASICANIRAWVDRFALADGIRLDTEVTRACRDGELWIVETPGGTFRSRHLLAATGAHNRPVVPTVERQAAALLERHVIDLRDPAELAGKRVLVVGGGASAFDLLDLCLANEAKSIAWVYRNVRWMMPSLKPKHAAGSVRGLAKAQAEGATAAQMSRALDAELRSKYAKHGLLDILPAAPFDLSRHQLVPGRRRMIEHFARIDRHPGEVTRIVERRVELSDGASLDVDVLLWATGYAIDLSFLANAELSAISNHDQLAAQCGDGMVALAEPNLYFLATGLESTGTAPWAYSLMARTLMAHIRGDAKLGRSPLAGKINHFHYPAFLASRDPVNFPEGEWQAELHRLGVEHPSDQPLPIPA